MRSVNAIENANKSEGESVKENVNTTIPRTGWARARETLHSSDGEAEDGESRFGRLGGYESIVNDWSGSEVEIQTLSVPLATGLCPKEHTPWSP